jgi:hypothetical protein
MFCLYGRGRLSEAVLDQISVSGVDQCAAHRDGRLLAVLSEEATRLFSPS